MWKNKIKQKKIQFLLIGMILMVASFILTVSLSFTNEVNNYTKKYYANDNIKDVLVYTYNKDKMNKINEYIDKYEKDEKDIKRTKGLNVDKLVFKGNENLKLRLTTLVVYEGEKYHPWDITYQKGEKTPIPNKGSVWVPQILADNKNLKVGDEIKIKDNNEYKSFTVSALVNDSMAPSSGMAYYNIFINEEDYNEFNSLAKCDYIGYNSSKEGVEATSSLLSYIGDSVDGNIIDRWTLVFAATATSLISSGIGTSVALVVFLASLFIIRFVLWNNILKEYKSIGIYKSLGFTSRQIKNIYLKSFGIVGITGITLGSCLSILFSKYLVYISVKYIGKYNGSTTNYLLVVLIIIVLSGVLLGTTYLMLRKLNKIKPVEALHIGVTSSKSKFKKSVIKDASSSFTMAINDIFKYKKQNSIILSVLCVVTYLAIFLSCINYSITNIENNYGNVFGLVQGDFVIDYPSNNNSYDDLIKELKRDNRILEVREGSLDTGRVVYIDSSKYNLQNTMVLVALYDNYENENNFNCSIKEGRNPKNKNEVALNVQILKDSNLKVGDYIKLKILGEERNVLITGSYTGMLSANYNMRMTLDVVPKEMIKELDSLSVNITLKDAKYYKEIREYYTNKYDLGSIDVCSNLVSTACTSIIEVVQPITILMVIGIVLFSIINIVNLIRINNTDNRRNNAILKSLGFSNSYIIKRNLYRISILTIIATIMGVVLNLLISRKLFSIALMGIDAFMIPYKFINLLSIGIALLVIICAAVSMNSIRKISIVELMEE